jgi:hypothetical protein
VPSEASAGEDTRVWIGRVANGREAEHARFVEWLNGPEAASIFRRRRLTEYTLSEDHGTVTVVFKAPHTGDPRLLIDFLRYPGVWPEFWQFERSSTTAAEAAGEVKVRWRPSTA